MGEGGERNARVVGRGLRLLTGVALVAEGARHLVDATLPLVLRTGGVVGAELALYSAMHLVIARRFRGVNAWLGAVLAVAPAAVIFFAAGAPGRLGTLLFVGISLLFSAGRAEGGCEVMTLPGMVLGPRTHLVCIAFSPIDWAEERIARKMRRSEPDPRVR